MSDHIHLEFAVSGNNFASAGSASEEVKSTLKKLGIPSSDIRRCLPTKARAYRTWNLP